LTTSKKKGGFSAASTGHHHPEADCKYCFKEEDGRVGWRGLPECHIFIEKIINETQWTQPRHFTQRTL
jgi:hypothetical protein